MLGLNVGSNGVSTLPDRFESKRGFVALQRDFPRATTDPVLVVVDHASDPQVTFALDRLRAELAPIAASSAEETSPLADGDINVLQVAPPRRSGGAAAIAGVRDLRSTSSRASSARTDATVLVGGDTAETATISTRSPIRRRTSSCSCSA